MFPKFLCFNFIRNSFKVSFLLCYVKALLKPALSHYINHMEVPKEMSCLRNVYDAHTAVSISSGCLYVQCNMIEAMTYTY